MNRKKGYIGISYTGCHDSNVTYFTDKVEFAASEERFSRIKKDGRPPKLTIEYLLSKYKISLDDVDIVSPVLPIEETKKLWRQEGVSNIYELIKDKINYSTEYIRKLTNSPIYVSHQDAHAASAYFTSGFNEKSLILVIDAGNYSDPYSTSIYEGNKGKLILLKQSTDNSIAQSYLLITAMLGFKPMKHEGKVTGLAPYGSYNKYAINDLQKILDDKEFVFRATKWDNFGSKNVAPELVITNEIEKTNWFISKYSKEDIAYAIQHITENKVLSLLKEYDTNEYSNICMAGGLFANVTLNRKIAELGFKKIFIHPAMGDDGLSLGSILYAKMRKEGYLQPFKIDNVYWGSEYLSVDIPELAEKNNLYCYKSNSMEQEIAEYLKNGKTVALYSGRMEYGPRALGNRSVLCHANNKDINDWLNKKLKRTEFMPFAPVIRDVRVKKLFKNTKPGYYTGNFMTTTFLCTEEMKKIAPGAVHIDGTARPQIVEEKANPFYYTILQKYDEITNEKSVLINTSFNMHEEPIVNTPQDAVKSFIASQLDVLVLNDFIITWKQISY